MRKLIILLVIALVTPALVYAQAKKPVIMIVPSDAWCNLNGFMLEYDNQGKKVRLPDYQGALAGSPDLLLAISKINELMVARGFPLKNLESSLKSLQLEAAEDALLTSKSGEGEISESPIDKLKKIAKADIWMQLTWTVNRSGPNQSVTFNLQGIDAYTDKQIAGVSGTGQASYAAEVPLLIEESILANIDNFNHQLQTYFDDLFTNGREIVLRLRKWNSFPNDFETEYQGKELNMLIEDWVANNTIKGRFSLQEVTENMMLFEQVRIPLFENNKAIDARIWARGLQRMLKDNLQIESKLVMRGLGQVTLVVGER